jgi:GT2 family glycosyltransferase
MDPTRSNDCRPTISIIVPHFNDLENLKVCLRRLADQDYPRDRFEIIVADNGSSVGVEAVAEQVGDLATVVLARERGAGPARNAGVEASQGDWLVFTDSDCRPAPDFLAEGMAALEGYDFVGGRIDVSVADPDRITPTEAFELVFAFHNDLNILHSGFSVSANLFVPRRVFQAVGGFRNGAPEDIDWCARARTQGYRIGYAPRSVVQHPARRTWGELVRKSRRLTNEFYFMFRQRPLGELQWIVRGLLLPLSVIPHSVVVLRSGALRSWRSRLDAIGVLAAIRIRRGLWAYEAMFHRL